MGLFAHVRDTLNFTIIPMFTPGVAMPCLCEPGSQGARNISEKLGAEKMRNSGMICISLPLIAGIADRAAGTSAALTGPELMTENGCLTEQGSDVFWDRATLYALRGIFYTGNPDKALEILHRFSQRRLLGEHVPYAVEAWPEGSQRHLSAESGLYCRVITEGLFGIRPTGLRSFMMNVNLPSGWNGMSLQHIRAFGSDFDLKVFRDSGNGLRVTVTEHTASGDKVRTLAPKQGKIFVNL